MTGSPPSPYYLKNRRRLLPRTAGHYAMAALAVVIPGGALAQGHAIADSSLAPSLLVAGLPVPMTRRYEPTDSVFSRRFYRFETQYSRTSTAGVPSMLVLGFRTDGVTLDSLDWNASVVGVRAGFARRGAANDEVTLSAVELYLGARTLGHMEGARANVGAEVVTGWSGIESNTRWSLAFRFPVEFIKGRGPVSAAFSIVPAMAWGHMRWRSCDDRGPDDGCGDLGQLAAGPTRFVLGTGVTVSLGPGFSLTAGAQHMFARTQQPRFALALAWGG